MNGAAQVEAVTDEKRMMFKLAARIRCHDEEIGGDHSVTVKLLYVDANKLVLKCIVQCATKHEGLDVSTAKLASQALKILKQRGPFDVIISDYYMPDMNGIELLRLLKEQQPESLRFLQSSCAETNIVSKAIEEGLVSHVFPKPVLFSDYNVMLSRSVSVLK